MAILIRDLIRRVGAAFKARHLFRDWISSLVSYVIGSDTIRVMCDDGSSGYLDRMTFGRLIRAYYEGLIKGYICRDGIVINKYGDEIPITEFKSLTLNGLKSSWRYINGFWVWDNIRFKHFYHTIYEVFNSEDYSVLNVNGKYVIDIGAFVGDSTIYFLTRNSRLVIAVEPHPQAFDELLINVRANDLLGRVLPINAAISYDNDYVCISNNVTTTRAISTYFRRSINYSCDFMVRAMSLSRLLSLIGIADPSMLVLKLDCEGCELDIITRDYDALFNFSEFMLEWHSRKLGIPIDRALSMLRDFDCMVIKNRLLHCSTERRLN